MTQQVDLDALTVNELKALAYDCLAIINKQQQNLQMIEQVIYQKQQPVLPMNHEPSTLNPTP